MAHRSLAERFRPVLCLLLVLLSCLVLSSRQQSTPERVVVLYTSLDQVHPEPILQKFKTQTGIKVNPV